jgi:hypothetical protein
MNLVKQDQLARWASVGILFSLFSLSLPGILSGQQVCNDEEGCYECLNVEEGGVFWHTFPNTSGEDPTSCRYCDEEYNDEGPGCTGCHNEAWNCIYSCSNHQYCYPEDEKELALAVQASDLEVLRDLVQTKDHILFNSGRNALQMKSCSGDRIVMHLPVTEEVSHYLRVNLPEI